MTLIVAPVSLIGAAESYDQHLKSLSFQGGQLYSHIAVLGHEIEAVKLCHRTNPKSD
jgi:hypothetical protein